MSENGQDVASRDEHSGSDLTGAANLPRLPNGWVWVPLGSIAEVKLGKMLSPKAYEAGLLQLRYLRNENVRWGSIRFDDLKSMGFKEQELERYSLRSGDLVVCEGGEAGRCAVYRGDAEQLMFQKALHRVRPFGRLVHAQFLQFCIQHYALSGTVLPRPSETTIQHLPLEKMVVLPIPVPPAAEQRRIVAEIEKQLTRLDAAVAALARVRANLKRYRASVLKAACEGRLVPTEAELARAEGRDYEPANRLLARILEERRASWETDQLARMQAAGKAPKDDRGKTTCEDPMAPGATDVVELPEGWAWTNLGQLKQFSLYGPRFSSSEYVTDGQVVLRTSDISGGGKVKLSEAPRLRLSEKEFAKYKVERHDLLITRTGSLGTLAVFNDAVDAIAGAYLIHYRLAAPLETSWYIFYVLKSPVGQRQLLGGGAGVGRPNLNAPTIEAIPVPLPPLAEQCRIVAEVERRLSVIDKLEASTEANLKRAGRMRQAILKRAFEGKLVPQDPNDEPAEVLLQRIRAKRERVAEARNVRRVGSPRKRKGAEARTDPLPLFDAV